MNDIASRKVIVEFYDMDKVEIRENNKYDESLDFDLYAPLHSKRPFPIAVFVFGFSDPMFGKGLKEMEQYKCWAKLLATQGIGAVTYSYTHPEEDLKKLINHLDQNAESLGIDKDNIALWACSGNVPLGLSMLAHRNFKCAALLYGYMIDLDGSSFTSDAAAQFGFVNPFSSLLVREIKTPLLIVRAGQDQMPNINRTIDFFVDKSLENNLPITVINHASGVHAFDLYNDDEDSKEIVKNVIKFFEFHQLKNG